MKRIILFALVVATVTVLCWRNPSSVAQNQKESNQKRIPWTTSKIKGSLEPPSPYRTERAFPNLTFDHPVALVRAPGTERLFLVELRGKIFSFPNRQDVEQPDVFVDLQTALPEVYRVYGLEFHPQFEQNRRCYICYIPNKKEQDDGTRVSQFTVTKTDPPRLEPGSEKILITWPNGGHNGGCLKFGPDGYLYISTGDAGPAFPPDPRDTGQDISDLPASILRIDVDRHGEGKPYRIPPDNPFVNHPGARGEVWAYGMRNPWRMSFDPVTGALWVGDVGWELWEMIYRVEKGANYGWSLVEGPQPVHLERKRGPTPIVKPTVVHSHTESRSITGGYVYRGKRLKELAGAYIYGDYVTGIVWGVRHDGKKITWQKTLVDSPIQIITFGVDHENELYIVDYQGGIFRLVPNPTKTANEDFPRKLSETGLFASMKKHEPAPGVYPYDIHAEPWMDGAKAERLLALPDLSRLGIHEKHDVWIGHIKGDWAFPPDAVLAKTISLPIAPNEWRRLETQIFHLDGDTWRAYSYIWNDQQTDATLAGKDGFDKAFTISDPAEPDGKRTQTWHFAGRTECLLCHTTRAGSIHGFKLPQIVDENLHDWSALGLFEKPVPPKRETWPNPYDESVDLTKRARTYLHVNCGHCHRRGGGGTAAIDLQISQPMKRTNLLGERPTQGTFEILDARVLAPGDPYRSILWYRMAKLGAGHMPHFGSYVVDDRGLDLIHDWIKMMPPNEVVEPVQKLRERQRNQIMRLKGIGDNTALKTLLSSTSGSLMILRSLDHGELPPPVAKRAIAKGGAHDEARIRDLFERFLPEEKRIKRLGSVIRPQTILALTGDAERGRKLFLESSSVQCRNCHRAGGDGPEVGPDLAGIGKKYNRAELLESILLPSKKVDPKFLTYLVETKQGLVHSGLMVQRDAKEVILRTAQNKEVRIDAENVLLVAPQQKSLMPELLLRDVTARDAADLLSFLETLK